MLNSITDAMIVVIACYLALIWLFGQARDEQRSQDARLADAVNSLYAPAYGLYQCKAYGSITQQEFEDGFRQLLLFHRSKADSSIIDDLDRWLRGEGQLPELNVRIEAKLKDLYIESYVAIHPDTTRIAVSSIKWLMVKGLGALLFLAFLINIFGGLWLFSELNDTIRVVIVLVVVFATLRITSYVEKTKRRKLETSMKAIRSEPGRKG